MDNESVKKDVAEDVGSEAADVVAVGAATEETAATDIEAENGEKINKKKKKDKREREKRKLSYYFTGGIILGLIGRLTDTIYRWLAQGLFGTMFTAYSKEKDALGGGAIKKYLLWNGKVAVYAKRVRGFFAEAFESSFFVSFFRKVNRVFLEMPLKNYGNYFFSFGMYTVFSYVVKFFVSELGYPRSSELVAGFAFVLIAIPLLSSKASLAEAVGSSAVLRSLLSDGFGFRDESFEIPVRQTKARANLSILFGMISGLLSFVVETVYIPVVGVLVLMLALLISTPEIGVVLSLFLIPFFSFVPYPSLVLALLMGVSAFGYVIKLIRGKRVFKIELADGAVVFFALLIFFSGAISMGGRASLYEALLACMLMVIYFLVVNMMRTGKWIGRCVIALVSSATFVSVVGIVEYFFGEVTARWLDVEYFPDIKGRVVSLFDNSNVLAFYLVMVFPFALDLLFRGKNKRERLLTFLSIAAMTVCVVLTWSRGAWIGLIAVTFLYMMIKTRRTLKAIFAICFAIPFLPLILPQNIIARFSSIGDMADSSTYYRFHTWLGSFELIEDHMWGGIGYGSSAFERIYPQYAHAGIEAAEHSHNLFLQIIISMGLAGLAVFIALMFIFAQKNLEYYKNVKRDSGYRGLAIAAFSSVVSAMCMGMFDHVWYNNRIFFLFWAVMGISCAVIRIEDTIKERSVTDMTCDKKSAFIDIG